MNGLHLIAGLLASLLIAVIVSVIVYNVREWMTYDDNQADIDTQLAMESMRRILESQTGREVSVAYRHRGYWWAQTARGPIRVDDLLRQGYVKVGRDA